MEEILYAKVSPSGATFLRILFGTRTTNNGCLTFIEVLESQNLGNFCLYTAIKCLWRLESKPENNLNNLIKCQDYLMRYSLNIPGNDQKWFSQEKLEMAISILNETIDLAKEQESMLTVVS